MFTPLPPARSGTADYAEALIAELGSLVDLRVFQDIPSGFDPQAFDSVLYQIGNNPCHTDPYRLALRHSGVICLHEANVHDLVRGLYQNRPKAYVAEVAYEIFGQEKNALEDASLTPVTPQPRSFTMLRKLLDRSTGCIVHSHFSEGEVRMKGFRGPVARIPHGAAVRRLDGSDYRRRLNLSDEPVIGILGYQRPDKRACECLTVFKSLLESMPEAHFLVVGQPHPEVPLADSARALGLEERVHLLGFQTLSDFDGYLAACDVVLNLRWPTFGETSGTMMRAFGLGKTVVVSDFGAARDLDEEICVRIPCDEYQDDVLRECLKWLLSDRAITAEIGAKAQAWVAGNCTWDRVARAYADFLWETRRDNDARQPVSAGNGSGANLADALIDWTPLDSPPGYFEKHATRLIHTLQLVPAGNKEDRILEMGCYLQMTPLLERNFGYGQVRGCYFGSGGSETRTVQSRHGEFFACTMDLFNAERDTFPYPNECFSTVLCCELLEHLQQDPMHMLSEIHRILRPAGVLLLTTPNAISVRAINAVLRGTQPGFYTAYPHPDSSDPSPKHAREYTPDEVYSLLGDAGFTVVHIETGPYSENPPERPAILEMLEKMKRPVKLRDDCIYALGRKTGAVVRRYPAWLYDL